MSNIKSKSKSSKFHEDVLYDFSICLQSRHMSSIGRKEVLNGKAKFGIFGSGKELAQVCLAKYFLPGDFRSGYYRDQTFALATGNTTIVQLFAHLYAQTKIELEPNSSGRMMNNHFSTRLLDEHGDWKNIMESKNFAADLSPTAAQMLKSLGLALASKLYRQNPNAQQANFTQNGNEISVVTIGDASTSEGYFWEALNAAAVMQVPLVTVVYDDGYGISVPKKYQTTKESISEALSGFISSEAGQGMNIYTVAGWNYKELCQIVEKAYSEARNHHKPALIHITEVTQPDGHSTSGSHERYKDDTRLAFEKEFDCIEQFKKWILEVNIADDARLLAIEDDVKTFVEESKKTAYTQYLEGIDTLRNEFLLFFTKIQNLSPESQAKIKSLHKQIESDKFTVKKDIYRIIYQIKRILEQNRDEGYAYLTNWLSEQITIEHEIYGSHLYSQSNQCVSKIKPIPAQFDEEAKLVNGFEIINAYFDQLFSKNPYVVAFGEDVGKIGDVNQGFAHLQEKYGESRIFDTGIREATIIGQGQGLSLRGFRPIAEIQYLDYLLYALQIISDDIATLQYRTRGGQKSPVIIRTRGHRLEGIWHSGSPMGMILNAVRGVYVLTPRNLTVAAGFYQTLIQADEPALVIEPLNGYRYKESMPNNLGVYSIEIGKVETIRSGKDITMLSYGSTLKICEEACELLAHRGIDVHLIDAQSLLPFDIYGDTVKSLKTTNRLVIVDEDVPGGASAYLLREVLEVQDGYRFLDSKPLTITAKAHRPAYGSDGDFFSKPNPDEIYEAVLNLMHEAKPKL